VAPTPRTRDISAKLLPSDLMRRACSMRSVVITVGRPPTRPSARARAKPSMVFCLMVSTRNCAKTATIPNSARPIGVVVSMSGSVRLLMLMPQSPSSVIV